jgi:hypothetical protein
MPRALAVRAEGAGDDLDRRSSETLRTGLLLET